MALTVNKTMEDNNTLIIAPVGQIDTQTSAEFQREIDSSLEGIENLIFDFSEVKYISSAGLRVLLVTHKKMLTQGKMVIRKVNDIVSDILDVTGFSELFEVEN